MPKKQSLKTGRGVTSAFLPARSTDEVQFRRIEKVNDRLFEGEEPIVHLMG
jgi:hypothetical protein